VSATCRSGQTSWSASARFPQAIDSIATLAQRTKERDGINAIGRARRARAPS
jgi:hypothetical protein